MCTPARTQLRNRLPQDRTLNKNRLIIGYAKINLKRSYHIKIHRGYIMEKLINYETETTYYLNLNIW